MAQENQDELSGQIERVTYANEDNGFVIARLKVAGRRDLVTVAGPVVNPVPGELLFLKGEWVRHPRYGEQFKISSCESRAPATLAGIEKYLGSGLIKGLGPVMARRIVRRFREETLEVIEKDCGRLAQIEGIGPKRIAQIKKAWEEQKEIRQIMIFLQSHGVGAGYAARIFKHYGQDSIAVLRENPYRLATDIFGIGFLTADKIAAKLGFSKDSPLRAEAGILYVLNELTAEGHCFYPYEPLLAKCQEILGLDRGNVVRALAALSEEKRIVLEDASGAQDERAVYLAGYHLAETSIAGHLRTLVAAPRSVGRIDAENALAALRRRLGLTLAGRQVEALRAVAGNKVTVITGGPGTGKTTIISALVAIFSRQGAKVLLAAPTGRAAKRMTEATGCEAKTIHRLLEYSYQKGGFQKNSGSPLNADLIIVDEASMIDVLLMHHLLKAVPPGAAVVFVGDVNQLPSVGPGSVLTDIISSGVVPVVELTEIFRQAKESSIIVNAHLINEGRMPRLGASPDKLDDFYFIEQEDPQRVLELIVTLVKERIPRRFGFDPLDDIQVLTPMHKGVVGGMNLNAALQQELNPGREGVMRMGRLYKAGDKVMQIANNYDKEVFNGDIGRIASIDMETQEVVVVFDGRRVSYDFTELDELVHAYAVSIHKAQGSEFPAVVIPIVTQHYVLLQRNLLYTAVTRGRKLVVLVGTKKALAIAVKNSKPQQRFTRLAARLSG